MVYLKKIYIKNHLKIYNNTIFIKYDATFNRCPNLWFLYHICKTATVITGMHVRFILLQYPYQIRLTKKVFKLYSEKYLIDICIVIIANCFQQNLILLLFVLRVGITFFILFHLSNQIFSVTILHDTSHNVLRFCNFFKDNLTFTFNFIHS